MNKTLWIDVIKGLGILTVVAGHIYQGEISHYIYLFHMPLFFFISGYLFKPTLAYKKYFTKKVIHLLIPYLTFLILLDSKAIIGFFYNLLSNSMTNEKWFFYKDHFFLMLYGGNNLKGTFAVFWFITCLFLTQQIINYLINKLSTKKLLPLIFIMLLISYYDSSLFSKITLPWNANVVFASLPIFYIGYLYKKQNLKVNHILLVVLLLITILFSFYFPENTYNMKNAFYGIPIITLISSIIIILNIKHLSEKLTNYKLTYLVFSKIGKASMVIMYVHQFIQITAKSYLSKNNTVCFLIATITSYIIYLVLSKFKLSKAIFLGSQKDLKAIFTPLMKKTKVKNIQN